MTPVRLLPAALGLMLLAACAAAAPAGDLLPGAEQRFATAVANAQSPSFRRHVVPLLGRLGCNGRSCHGSFQGQGGFRLSMFGYDFTADHESLTAGNQPRVDVKHPTESLILNKPTHEDQHGGGQRYERGGWEYHLLQRWIESGAPNDSAQTGDLSKLEIVPGTVELSRLGQAAPLKAIAHWSDGTREDVTCLVRFATNDDAVADVSPQGRVKATGRGDTHIIVSYDQAVVAIPVLMPVTGRSGPRYPHVPTPTRIDELVVDKLRKLGIVPSEPADDAEFLRRASLDVTGTLPTPDEVRTFLADSSADKRGRKIDELLERPAYAVWWATLFCDLTGLNASLQLGSTEFGPIMGDRWLTWLRRRIETNSSYDRIVQGMVVAVSREPGQDYIEFALSESAYERTQDRVDYTARESMPNFWFRGNLAEPEDKALAFAHTFLGVRLDCAQCHKHPFDVWTQDDFRGFSAVFAPVKWGIAPDARPAYDKLREELGVPQMKNAAERRQSYWRWARQGKAVPWPEVYIATAEELQSRKKQGKPLPPPKLLGGAPLSSASGEDPRVELMAWLRSPNNPYFARSLVNRVWAHYFGRGIVHPPDDLNLANPPSNGPLLDDLSRRFVEHGYDLKWLHREITGSRAYQTSWRANDTNRSDERNFSRATIRRLPAEVAVDAIDQATLNTQRLAQAHQRVDGRRIGVQATADERRTEFGLVVFGKPLRTVNCDCERTSDPSLLQSIYIRNDEDVRKMFQRAEGWLAEKRLSGDPEALVEEAYLRTLSRRPSDAERVRCLAAFTADRDPRDALHDVLWALVNTQEFITNH